MLRNFFFLSFIFTYYLLILNGSAANQNNSVDSTRMAKTPCIKALLLIVEGSEEIELVTPADLLRRAGISVCIAGLEGKDCVKCSRDIKICPDVAFSDVKNDDYDIVILPGGPGHKKFRESQEVKELLQKQQKNDKWIAAICAAPTALKSHGICLGQTLTSYPGVKDEFKDGQCKYSEEKVVVSGKLITSRSPATAFEFALTIIEKLVGKDARDKVAEETYYV
ncbi:Parkinson disease protein 7 homolog [Planococcus citri]|uniref:Parkinson disease protein 7 homolog n=1 Tax=Planococcus citri TaxID=170843 RepID=UPI0031F86F55